VDPFLISYDICAPKRLRAVASLLEDHGRRLQQSVFVCTLSPDDRESLVASVLESMECPPDHLWTLPLSARSHDSLRQYGTEVLLPSGTDCYIA
jgi:CRISPR-associated protein Cas2